MYWLDVLLLTIIGWLGLMGLRKGFIRGLFELGGAALGLYVGLVNYEQLGEALTNTFALPPAISHSLAFGALALAIGLGLSLVGVVWSRAVSSSRLQKADKVLGIGLGAAKGFILLAVLLTFITLVPARPVHNVLENSIVAEKILLAVPPLYSKLEGLLLERLPRGPGPGLSQSTPTA
ncbi:MAG: CvpA family protein [Limnochordia bacterium]